MKIKVDPNLCIGCGLCTTIAPEDFEMGADGKAKPKNETAVDETAARQAVLDCPVQAITIEE